METETIFTVKLTGPDAIDVEMELRMTLEDARDGSEFDFDYEYLEAS